MKPQPKAAAKAQKAVAKPQKTVAKAVKTPVKAKSVASAKPVAKSAAKPAAKPSAKPAAKPVAKKPAAKAPAKAPAKAVVKAAAKAPAKKAAAKPAVKAAKAAPAKPAAKVTEKPAAKPKTPAKTTAPSAPAKKTAPPPANAAAPQAAPAKQPAPAVAAAAGATSTPVAAVAAASVPPRATRPSARLAQITVPSMAQAVASTAAKASYLQTPSPSVLTSPPLVVVKKDPKLANNWKTKTADQLTDAEVLAMPDGEYMNDKQMAFFRLKLTQLKQDILNSAGETTEHLREDTVIVPDPADRATIEEEHALELRTRDRERKLLKKIEQSIARIDAGDYGYCDETGEPIGVGRLLARPTATLSLEAQQRRELKQKMFGD